MYSIFRPRVSGHIVACLFGPLEMAVAAVLPGETSNHGGVEEPAYGGFARGKEGYEGRWRKKER